MEDKSSLTIPQLRAELQTHGFALLRGVLDPVKVAQARAVVTSQLHKSWQLIDTARAEHTEAYILPHEQRSRQKKAGGSPLLLTGYTPITHHRDVLQVLEGSELEALFRGIFEGEDPCTYQVKWVRIMDHGENTDEHTDYFRFAHQAQARNMYTCWIPLGNYTVDEGTLAVCARSHLLTGFGENPDDSDEWMAEGKRELPLDFDAQDPEWQWFTADFQMGDVCVFDIRAVHASTPNLADRFRISMDTRWQASSRISPLFANTFVRFSQPAVDAAAEN
eukprot:TRINITY_DN3347_c0_g2_i3.p1 TRINITY_DN3347_c0_g2~~TRINITY_DN3347_c0_g2_i3.p1  ORF type:complete len:305 (+),score=64.44 TRINITY_DN3347_c0_g2_i3:87-917(+)